MRALMLENTAKKFGSVRSFGVKLILCSYPFGRLHFYIEKPFFSFADIDIFEAVCYNDTNIFF